MLDTKRTVDASSTAGQVISPDSIGSTIGGVGGWPGSGAAGVGTVEALMGRNVGGIDGCVVGVVPVVSGRLVVVGCVKAVVDDSDDSSKTVVGAVGSVGGGVGGV